MLKFLPASRFESKPLPGAHSLALDLSLTPKPGTSVSIVRGYQGDSRGIARGEPSPCYPLAIPLLSHCFRMACGGPEDEWQGPWSATRRPGGSAQDEAAPPKRPNAPGVRFPASSLSRPFLHTHLPLAWAARIPAFTSSDSGWRAASSRRVRRASSARPALSRAALSPRRMDIQWGINAWAASNC